MKTYDDILKDLMPTKFGTRGVIWVSALVFMVILGIIAYADQLIKGQVVTNMRDYALWGVYISNFVYFVATSFVGSVAVAILRLTKTTWRTPIVRIAEVIAISAIIMAGLTIIIDMARPDRLLNLFLHGRLQSPITWDVIIIPTFMAVSILLLYFPVLPDLAILRDKNQENKPFLTKIYTWLALGWKGSAAQKAIQGNSITIVAVLTIVTGIILQTIDAWLFSTTYRIGWDSTNLGPYFLSGALVAGFGALITVTYVLRKVNKLEDYITDMHFSKLGKLMVFFCLVYLYFNVNEYLLPIFTPSISESAHLDALFTGHYAWLFWFVVIGGLVVPAIIMMFPKGRKPFPMFIMGLLIVFTSWWKRYIIVTPTLLHPFLPIQGVPEEWHGYFPSVHEWIITLATLAAAMLIITIVFRYIPVVPMHRTAFEKGLIDNENNKES